jgi:hypothetical protein
VPSQTFARIAFSVLLLVCICAADADAKPKVKYVPPEGFNGHLWGELRTSPAFGGLPEKPVGVGAAWMEVQQRNQTFDCIPSGSDPTGCSLYETLDTLRARYEGGGYYVLSEYTDPEQGARFGSVEHGVMLYPVVYQFCANWHANKATVPATFDQENKFCGVRLMFKSETREELRKLPRDHETVYDRVLERLIAKYGKPDNFLRTGRVFIESDDGSPVEPDDRKFKIWRWCPAPDRDLHTNCTASVVLAIDPATGKGTVMYSTPLLWEYAYARQFYGFKGDPLFKVLHARKR